MDIPSKPVAHNVDYENKHVDLEYVTRKYFRSKLHQRNNTLNNVATVTTNVAELQQEEADANIVKLPISYHKQSVVKSIDSYKSVIIEGGTGSGKSTRVPFYILEDFVVNSKQCANIYVTQPRRIAAKNIAKRVCHEHEWELGSIVGYHIGLEKVTSPDTMLTFCTAGVLLKRLLNENCLDAYSHIVIDEVHERDADTDLLLMIIKQMMLNDNSNFRLVIMSATINMDSLVKYLSWRQAYGHCSRNVPMINRISPAANSGMSFDISIEYLDQIAQRYEFDFPEFRKTDAELSFKLMRLAVKIILQYVPMHAVSSSYKSVLVFLPGLSDIEMMSRLLQCKSDGLDIIPLHSCLSSENQNRVFEDPKPGITKIILATNIAESSITVRDVAFVIDFCFTKVLTRDSFTNYPCLKLIWESKDQATQRAGRSGRCCPGKVFRMVTKSFFDSFDKYATPELQRAPLELSVLKVKQLDMGNCKEMLQKVMDPPNEKNVSDAILQLKQISALDCMYKGKISLDDGDLTDLGKIISVLPIDVHASKLIIFGYVFDVMEAAITIAASMSANRSIIRHNANDEVEIYERKLDWAASSQSDLIINLTIIREFKSLKTRGKSIAYIRDWCDSVKVDEAKLNEVLSYEKEIIFRLAEFNMRMFERQGKENRGLFHEELMLKLAFSAAFYPNYFISSQIDRKQVDRQLVGQDPTSTIILSNFSSNAILYYRQICNQMITDDIKYFCDNYRALIRFNKDKTLNPTRESNLKKAMGVSDLTSNNSNAVSREVYLTLKRCQRTKLECRPYKELAVVKRIKYFNQKKVEAIQQSRRLPPTTISIISGREPDNAHLFDQSKILNAAYDYIEIRANEPQDEMDMQELNRIEMEEDRMIGENIDEPRVHSEIFDVKNRQLDADSPIALKFESILQRSRSFQIIIERNSINSILLDANYESDRSLLVAARLTQSQRNSHQLTTYQTTLMPHIRGLASLFALLFAPYYRYKYESEVNCYGACFSLGWDTNGQSLNEDYDVNLEFDVAIDDQDIAQINRCRQLIASIHKMVNSPDPGKPLLETQSEVRKSILDLIIKGRKPREISY